MTQLALLQQLTEESVAQDRVHRALLPIHGRELPAALLAHLKGRSDLSPADLEDIGTALSRLSDEIIRDRKRNNLSSMG